MVSGVGTSDDNSHGALISHSNSSRSTIPEGTTHTKGSNAEGDLWDATRRQERRTDFFGRITISRLRLFVSNPVLMLEVQMMARYSKRLNDWLIFGKVLCVSLLTICIFAGSQARTACALLQEALTMGPNIKAIVQRKTHEGDLARCFLRYSHALKYVDEIDSVVTPEGRFHDLEAIGYPKGPEGLKAFRRWLNAKLPDETGKITAMRFVGDDIIEVDIEAKGTDPKTGQDSTLTIHARDRFVCDRAAERWDKAEWHTTPSN
jgi:hypothetical protein